MTTKRKLALSSLLVAALLLALLPAQAATAATTVIAITSPRTNQVIQRNLSTGSTDITVAGTVSSPLSLEASSDGATWMALTTTGTSFSGILPAVPVGRTTFTVRAVGNPTLSASVTNVGVGDVYAVIGDSNSVGLGIQGQSYTGLPGQVSLFTQAQVWRPMTADPIDRIDEEAPLAGCWWVLLSCVHHALYDAGQNGSIWPLLASRLAASQPSLPIGLVVMARGGSLLACDPTVQNALCWQKPTGAWATDRYRSLYADMSLRLRALGPAGSLRAAIWFEGINDVFATNYAGGDVAYQGYLARLAADLNNDFGPLPLVVSQPGDCDPALSTSCVGKATGLDNVRRAVETAWAINPQIVRGAVLYDINKSEGTSPDGLHYKSNASLSQAAIRLDGALEAAFYGGSSTAGPRLAGASRAGDNVTLNFDRSCLTPGQDVGGVNFKSGTAVLSGVVATAVSSTKATASLPSGTGAVTVSVATGRSGQSASLPRDPSGLPVEPAYDQPVGYLDIDTTPPTGSVVIGGGAVQTTTTAVTLSVNGSDDRSLSSGLQMQISNTSDFATASWQPFSTAVTWQLAAGSGMRTVYLRLRDEAGNVSAVFSDSIELVTTQAPVTYIGGQLSLDGNNALGFAVRPVDWLSTRGTVNYNGVSYIQRNDVTRCGAGCVQGSAVALLRPTLTWRVDQAAGTATTNGASRQIVTGSLSITP